VTGVERARVALRYTFAFGRGHLSAFLSLLSMLGLVLAISLLIIVLSVMNGFDKEMRERILALVPHITIYVPPFAGDWLLDADSLREQPGVQDVTPFVEFDTLLMRGRTIETARGIGLDVARGASAARLLEHLGTGNIQRFRDDERSIALGAGLAAKLAVSAGDALTLLVPQEGGLNSSAAPRFERVTVAAVLDTGTELDQAIVLLHLSLAAEIAGLGDNISGYRVAVDDLFGVREQSWDLRGILAAGHTSTNWMMTHGNLYAAIQLSRSLVSILLFSIIAVAAFNVVSSLVLVVLDKQGNIAILRTLGAGGRDIAWIFLLQGAMIGLVGVVLGSLLGVLGSLAVPGAVMQLEALLELRFLSTDVYPVSFLPVDVLAQDVVWVGSIAFLMCVLAAIYPARRAAALAPAAILNQER
jgi:lipoprotein-releasing system permease protein